VYFTDVGIPTRKHNRGRLILPKPAPLGPTTFYEVTNTDKIQHQAPHHA
jgi:hypothetical protein